MKKPQSNFPKNRKWSLENSNCTFTRTAYLQAY